MITKQYSLVKKDTEPDKKKSQIPQTHMVLTAEVSVEYLLVQEWI